MTETERPSSTGMVRHRRRRGRRRWARGAVAFWSEWRVEILIVLLVAVALFLLLERLQIRQTLRQLLQSGAQALVDRGLAFMRGVASFLRQTTLSDLLGYTLLLIALVIVVQRTRWRLMTLPRFTERRCPRCGSELHRIHRRGLDRALNLFVPVRRYQCRDGNCRWRGLRVGRSRHL